jgi:hypothetical protein
MLMMQQPGAMPQAVASRPFGAFQAAAVFNKSKQVVKEKRGVRLEKFLEVAANLLSPIKIPDEKVRPQESDRCCPPRARRMRAWR